MSTADYSDFGKAMVEVTKKAGDFVQTKWASSTHNFSYKVDREIVTEVDLQSQEILVTEIQKRFPAHGILAEENDMDIVGDKEYKWIIDPIDGTTNFAHSYPCFCVSVGLEHMGEIVAGAVYDPTREEMFRAVVGGGAFLNDRQIHVSKAQKLQDSLLCTGFPYDLRESSTNLKEFCKFALCSQGIRRDGSAALDLCYVACGRFDGFWEMTLKPWDIAGGYMIIKEAGGKITSCTGGKLSIYGQPVLATNGQIHDEMLGILSSDS